MSSTVVLMTGDDMVARSWARTGIVRNMTNNTNKATLGIFIPFTAVASRTLFFGIITPRGEKRNEEIGIASGK